MSVWAFEQGATKVHCKLGLVYAWLPTGTCDYIIFERVTSVDWPTSFRCNLSRLVACVISVDWHADLTILISIQYIFSKLKITIVTHVQFV